MTIYEALAIKLGREPTHREQCDEVQRILREAAEERCSGYSTELTEAGEQTVIPGCERNASPKLKQLNLFG